MESRTKWVVWIVAGVVIVVGTWFVNSRPHGLPLRPDRVIAQIDAGLKAYKTDFETYPPSGAVDVDGVTWSGGQRMALLLTGYLPDVGEDETPAGGDPIETRDDGKEGFGFRLAPGGLVWGPYAGTDELRMSGGARPCFVDRFKNPVC